MTQDHFRRGLHESAHSDGEFSYDESSQPFEPSRFFSDQGRAEPPVSRGHGMGQRSATVGDAQQYNPAAHEAHAAQYDPDIYADYAPQSRSAEGFDPAAAYAAAAATRTPRPQPSVAPRPQPPMQTSAPHPHAAQADAPSSRLGKVQWGGALVSAALVAGLCVWGYKLVMRDVNGVPVIRAMEGAARSVPDDPGGQLATYQGLAVNSVTADGSAAPPADRLVLAPKPIELTRDDKAMGQVVEELTAVDPAPVMSAEADTPVADGEFETLAIEADPLELASIEAEIGEDDLLADALQSEGTPIPLDAYVSVSPVPRERPRGSVWRTVPSRPEPTQASLDNVAGDILAAVGSEVSVRSDEVLPEAIPAGTHLVQLGAFKDPEIARAEWERLTGKFSDFMTGKVRVIETANSSGATFYRLRAQGFEDAADSNRFCAALTSMNAACVPVTQR